MLTDYIQAAMGRAVYELLAGDEGYYGEIPGLQGVLGTAATLEACRTDLQSALEDWILFRLRRGHAVPVLGGIDLNTSLAAEEAA